MLKVKRTKPQTPKRSKGKKAPKAKKIYIKPPSTTVQQYQESHYKTHQINTKGYFNPFAHNSGVATSSSSLIPHYTLSGGIPYTSIFESYGITNKAPYFLDSFITKNAEANYQQPIPSQTSSTLSGSNPMSTPKTKTFETQTKTDTVDYVDLVAPATKGNTESQPDFISVVPMKTLTKKEKNENKMMANEEIETRIIEHKRKERKERSKEVKQNIMDRIAIKKRLRGTKNNEEL